MFWLARKIIIPVTVAFVVVMLWVAWIFAHRDSCQPLFPARDTGRTVFVEKQELMKAMLTERRRVKSGIEKNIHIPTPLRVQVSGFTANVTVDSRLDSGDYAYAEKWYSIYHKYHSGKSCVRMRVTWDSQITVREWPPPLTF